MEAPRLYETHMAGGLYIHVAFCRHKCIYCDFYSAGSRIADWERYTDSLIAEFYDRIGELPTPLHTVYLGGGTPSIIPPEYFKKISSALKPYVNNVKEFTIEANPDDITDEMLRLWKDAGINRISIGIQTFHDNILKKIGRLHDASTAISAYRLAAKHIANVSIDLMFGLPGQTMEMWKEDIRIAISLRPQHISAYSLMYEPGTALTLLRDKGRMEEAPEELSEDMFLYLIKALKEAGYEHYEFSNFALPGYRSQHNSSYWNQSPYLGIGPSAHSYDGNNIRKANIADLNKWMDGVSPEIENLSLEELQEEYIMTRLRTREGIPMADFETRFGKTALRLLLKKAKPAIEAGQVIQSDTNLFIHESAILQSDPIILSLI